MQFKFRAIATVVFAGLALALAGCSTSTPKATVPTVVPTESVSTTSDTPTTMPLTTERPEDNMKEYQEALDYLQSSDRNSRYMAVVPKAGKLIAKALEDRVYGPTKRYDENKSPLAPGYVGWGGISSSNNQQFAWVFWNKGKIDYTKPITQIAIDYVDGDPTLVAGSTNTGVSMFAPSSPESKDSIGSYWDVYLNTSSGGTLATSASDIGYPHTTPHDSDCGPGFRYPESYTELINVDTDALRTLNANMTSHFGEDWKDR